jgi:hypothetical protein
MRIRMMAMTETQVNQPLIRAGWALVRMKVRVVALIAPSCVQLSNELLIEK